MRHLLAWKLPALVLVLVLVIGPRPVLAMSAADAASPVAVEATQESGSPAVVIAPLPDEALPGAYCLVGTAAAMIAVFAIGPSEGLMLLSGAMHVPSGTAVMFIPLMSILGGSVCALAAAAQPAVGWALEQSDNIAARFASAGESMFAGRSDPPANGSAGANGTGSNGTGTNNIGTNIPATALRPLTEDETQSAGCIAGALAGFAGALATSPTEVTMLSSGANTIVSSTPILVLGLLGSIVASGCVIGTYAILPVQAFIQNFNAIGDSLLSGLDDIGTAVSEAAARTLALLKSAAPQPRAPTTRRPAATS